MPKKAETLPLIMKCPIGGEEWPATSYKSTYDTIPEKFTGKCMKFQCPGDHFFTLTKAVSTGMLTKAQGNRLIRIGRKEVEEYRKLNPAQQAQLLEKKLKERDQATGW
jgi:hypothetical protein